MPRSHRPSVRGKRYVVSSVHYLATMGGVRILESGGNAADAGIAVGILYQCAATGIHPFWRCRTDNLLSGVRAARRDHQWTRTFSSSGEHRLLSKISRRRPAPRNLANRYTRIARCVADGVGTIRHHDL